MRKVQSKKGHKKIRPGIHNIVAGKKFFETMADLLYPKRCPFCDEILYREEKMGGCCSKCRTKLPWVTGSVCMKCGKPVKFLEQEYCADCQSQRHVFDQGMAAFTYSGCMPGSIYRMKFSNRRDYLDFYADAMTAACRKKFHRWQPEVIVPVPMHPLKRGARGYNQSELLAKKISSQTGIPADMKMLQCIRKTKVQKSLDKRERQKNLRGSFVVKQRPAGIKRVLVIDDVYTTGSTMDEIARILKEAGVMHVYFCVLCTGKGKNSVCMRENVCYTEK